jgi:hypothetical protein
MWAFASDDEFDVSEAYVEVVEPPEYYAVLVGPHYPGGATFDDTIAGTRMTDLATELGEWDNWDPANITTLTGAVTKADITNALSEKSTEVNDGDFFLFVYHGHGDYGNGNGGESSLSAVDEDFSLPGGAEFTDDELGAAIGGFSNDATKLAIALSCFGGGMWGGGDGDMPTTANTAFFAGSGELQTLSEPPAFYTNLFNAIQPENSGTITIEDLYNVCNAAGGSSMDNWDIDEIPYPGVPPEYASVIFGDPEVLATTLLTPVDGSSAPPAVPEPATLTLVALGALGLVVTRRAA